MGALIETVMGDITRLQMLKRLLMLRTTVFLAEVV